LAWVSPNLAQGQLERAGEAEAVDLGHDDFGHRGEQVDRPAGRKVEQVAHRAALEGAPAEGLEVDTGAERPALTGEHDHPDGGVVGEVLEGVAELVEHRGREGVERLGAGHGHRGDGAVGAGEDGRFVGHGVSAL
jgi:hypothetical protein